MAPTEAELVADARRRREAFRARLEDERIDAAIVANQANFTYLTGYATPSWANPSRPIALVVPADAPAAVVISAAEVARIREWDEELEADGYRDPAEVADGFAGPNYVAAAVDAVAARLDRGSRAAIELSLGCPCLPPASLTDLERRLGLELVDLDPVIRPLRALKTKVERDCLGEAGQALGRAFEAFGAAARPGMTERELTAELTAAVARSGADRLAYSVVVAGAERPLQGPPTDREWSPGELLAVDAVLVAGGYWADFCRHFAAVEASAAQLSGYARIVDAVREGRARASAGSTAAECAAAIGAGLGPNASRFGRVGHGVGLELGEPPSLHSDDLTRLEAGMTLCVEPSAQFAGVGQLVAEEMVAVEDGGASLLSPEYPEELPVVAA